MDFGHEHNNNITSSHGDRMSSITCTFRWAEKQSGFFVCSVLVVAMWCALADYITIVF